MMNFTSSLHAGCAILSLLPISASAAQAPHPSSNAVTEPSQETISSSALRAAADNTDVRQVYEDASWKPLWTASSRGTLNALLDARRDQGLDRVSFLDADAPKTGGAKTDVAYTLAATAYANALAYGIVDPATLHDVYTLRRPREDLSKAFLKALKEGKLQSWLQGLAPHDDGYVTIADAYVKMASTTKQTSEKIATDGIIEVGDTDDRIPDIATELVDEEYLDGPEAGSGDKRLFTQHLSTAVKALQRDYGIADDGIIGPNTLAVLNLGPGDKARSLAVALERRRWLSRTPPATRIDVNTAAARLSYFRDGKVVDQRRVIVGKPGNETPPLGSPIYRLVANPTWTVPKSIQNGELANVGSSYFRAHNMKMQGGWIVQQPGPDNALGLVKFDMRNDQAIYLHDTSAPSLFEKSQRHLSHGCVRVADALDFARMLAEQEGVGETWRKAHDSGEYTIVDLPQEIPVRLLYENVFVRAPGQIGYRTDPYGWNAPIAKALGFGETRPRQVKAQTIDVGP